jgi:hypothetical protein
VDKLLSRRTTTRFFAAATVAARLNASTAHARQTTSLLSGGVYG